jgi:hypothetical protein
MNILSQLSKVIPGALISVIIMLFIRIRLFKQAGERILLFGLETAKSRNLKTILLEFTIQFIGVVFSRLLLLKLKSVPTL